MKFDNLKIQVFYWSREWALSEDLKKILRHGVNKNKTREVQIV